MITAGIAALGMRVPLLAAVTRGTLHRCLQILLQTSAGGLVLAGAALIPYRERVRLDDRVVVPMAMAGGIVLWTPIAVLGHSATIAGVRYWWLSDDAMISMRYASNLAHGYGLVWNPGQRVEGFTNPLWTLYMALVHLLPLDPSKTSLVILLTNIAIAAATTVALARLVRQLGGGSWATAAALAAYVLSLDSAYWAASGLETSLLALIVTVSAYRIIREADSGPRFSTYLLTATLALVRTDAVVLTLLLDAMALAVCADRRRGVRYCAVCGLLPVS